MYSSAMNALPSPPESNLPFGPHPHPHPHPPNQPINYRQMTGNSLSAGILDGSSSGDPHSYRLRRQPSIFYSNSGQRGERERTPGTSRLLVVVMPPAFVVREHATQSINPSLGPAHRLGQGVIMPLSPNMTGQLAAIAKEFNFPSIAGICLYYCYQDDGVTMTPRLSDEVWTAIWGINDGPQDRRPPFAGKMEFDIDTTKARWYTAWLLSRQGDAMGYHFPQTSHYREDSRATFPQTENPSEQILQRSAPISRHVPRKLSLVERFDVGPTTGAKVPNFPAHQINNSAEIIAAVPSQVLSPIKQQDEPKSARALLDTKIETWRQNAGASPVAIEGGSSQLDSFQEPISPSQESIRMEDFAWSISSHGPDDKSFVASSADSWAPSIHLCDRVNGSVAPTATSYTSRGPSEYSIYFPMEDEWRVMSPDIAHRMYEDAPISPLTNTSWGAPSDGYEYSNGGGDYPGSIDAGHRGVFSRPVTPTTATSWGPASDDGWVPESPNSAISVHIDARGEYSRPVTPQTATSWGPSTGPTSPLSPYRLPTPDIAHRGFEDGAPTVLQRWIGRPSWRHAWPYSKYSTETRATPAQTSSRLVPIISQVIPNERKRKQGKTISFAAPNYPQFDLYPAVMPLPYINAGYPDFVLYPPLVQKGSTINSNTPDTAQAAITITPSSCTSQYPNFDLYPAVYPYNLDQIYRNQPTRYQASQPAQREAFRASAQYPFFDLYPALRASTKSRSDGQPPNDIVSNLQGRKKSAVLATSVQYPHFNIYPAVYPFNLDIIYERPVHGATVTSYPGDDLKAQPEGRSTGYPNFILYAPVYPFFSLYPPLAGKLDESDAINKDARNIDPSRYPYLDIYPAAYPHFNLYPAKAGRNVEKKEASYPRNIVAQIHHYPYFNLYPAVYPHFDLWPYLTTITKLPTLAQGENAVVIESQRATRARITHAELHARIMHECKSQLSLQTTPIPPMPELPIHVRSSSSPSPVLQSRLSPTYSSRSDGTSGPPNAVQRSGSLRRTASLAQRRSIWEANTNGAALARASSVKTEAPRRRRDSIVLQRIRRLTTSTSELVDGGDS